MTSYSDFRNAIPTTSTEAPKISTTLDVIKNYQFEVEFVDLPPLNGNFPQGNLTIGATKVTAFGMTVDTVEIHRVNDRVYYPGKAKFEPVTITFDNQLLLPQYAHLWEYIKTVYNPLTGQMYNPATGARNAATLKTAKMKVRTLNGQNAPVSETTFWGVFPMDYKIAELKYSDTNTGSTIDVKFSVDLMDIRTLTQPT